jgi:hypothetical protein
MKKDTVTPILSAKMSIARSSGDGESGVMTLMLPKVKKIPTVKMASATRKPIPELIPKVRILNSPV